MQCDAMQYCAINVKWKMITHPHMITSGLIGLLYGCEGYIKTFGEE